MSNDKFVIKLTEKQLNVLAQALDSAIEAQKCLTDHGCTKEHLRELQRLTQSINKQIQKQTSDT